MHRLPPGAAPPWCLSSARTGLRVMPRPLGHQGQLCSGTGQGQGGLTLCTQAFAGIPLPDTCRFSEQVSLSLAQPCLLSGL